MSGYLEQLEARLVRLESQMSAKSRKLQAPAGYMNESGLARYFSRQRENLRPDLVKAVALGRVKAIVPKGGVRKVYSIADVERELFNVK